MTPAIDVRSVRKSFGGTAVLADLDLTVERGTVFALLGPNGAGKTTLINILSTLVRPDSGTASVDGHDVVRESLAVRRSIGLTGQSAAVDGVLTGAENIRMMARLSGLSPRQAKAREVDLLERFGLDDAGRKRAATYSGGMRRRLDLALSLVVTPSVLFLDEPTTGLDTRSRLALWDVIRSLRDEGTTVFLTTQYLEEADQLADRIAVLDRGVIVAQGTADELKRRTGGEVVELRGDADELLEEIPTDGTLSGLRRAIDELDARYDDGAVTLRKPSLDDVFLTLTGSADTSADKKELVRK
ncbi:MAG: transporter ATP-binding protein [Rhodoglobus sp.]|nr:transporter ATP-binding protein [Rhodoglobus sp.]